MERRSHVQEAQAFLKQKFPELPPQLRDEPDTEPQKVVLKKPRLQSPSRPPSSWTGPVKWTEQEIADLWVKKNRMQFANAVARIHCDFSNLPEHSNRSQLERDYEWLTDRRLYFYPQYGGFPWNVHKERPLRHSYRMSGDGAPKCIRGFQWSMLDSWQAGMREDTGPHLGIKSPPELGFRTLVTWLRNRDSIWSQLRSIQRCHNSHWERYGFKASQGWRGMTPELGCWWRLRFEHTQEPDEIASRAGHEVGYHGTAMYCMHSQVHAMNCFSGWATNVEGKAEVRGIFYMAPPQAHCCWNYMMYNQLTDDGWLYAPLLELAVDRDACQQVMRKITLHRGQKQRVCIPEYCKINAVYFPQVHITELLASDTWAWYVVEPGFQHMLEIDPWDSWEQIVQRSQHWAVSGDEPET